jgi:hypothetical protein
MGDLTKHTRDQAEQSESTASHREISEKVYPRQWVERGKSWPWQRVGMAVGKWYTPIRLFPWTRMNLRIFNRHGDKKITLLDKLFLMKDFKII